MTTALLWQLILAATPIAASRDFDELTCRQDIRAALIGRRMTNARVVVLEKRYRNIRLENLGAYEPVDGTTLIFWRICGDSYALLQRTSRVTDAIKIQGRRTMDPSICTRNGTPGHFDVQVLWRKTVIEKAWTIDDANGKFNALSPHGLHCQKASD